MRARPLVRWRDQTRRRIALLVACGLLFLVLTCWNLARGGDFDFYASAARSMSESWRALAFGAFDPAGTVTLDKLAGFAVPQAMSVALFGMSTSALALPQVIEGLVTIWACSVVALRWAGPRAGLLAAAVAATTPIFVSMFAHPMEDGLLTMALAVAVLWWQRALLTGRLWPLLLAGLFVGIGFQAKMMQAWFVLPALVLGALVCAGPWWRRLARAALVAAASVVASLAWITVIALVPAGRRPYIDGSTDDNVFAMVFGYNGVDRLIPNAVAGAVGSHATAEPSAARLLSAFGSEAHQTAATSVAKLVLPEYATQIGWLYPIAIAGAALALLRWAAPGSRTAGARAVAIALVVWAATAAGVLSLAHLPHTAYLAAIGVPVALLAVVGWREGLRLARTRSRARFVLTGVLVAQLGWGLWLGVAGAEPPALLALGAAVTVVGLAVAAVPALRRRARVGLLAVLTGTAVVAAQLFFSLQVLDAARDGSGGDASVGIRPRDAAVLATPFHLSAPEVWGGAEHPGSDIRRVIGRAEGSGGGLDGRPLMLTDSWALSAAVISTTGRSVLTDGGYSGSVPVFSESAVRALISSGEITVLAVSTRARRTDPVRAAAHAGGCHGIGDFSTASVRSGRPGDASFALYRCR